MQISKQDIIKALQTESLAPGQFFRGRGFRGDNFNPLTCSVCAVGAVLRAALKDAIKDRDPEYLLKLSLKNTKSVAMFNEEDEDYFADAEDYIASLLKEGNYLGALSVFFEETYPCVSDAEGRQDCIAFVEANFPASLEIEAL